MPQTEPPKPAPSPPAPAKRIDPPSRPVDGAINDTVYLVNKDPARAYMTANPNDFHTGVAEALRQGWVIELVRKDGPRVIGGAVAADGSELRMNGDVWMSMPMEEFEIRYAKSQKVADDRSQVIGQPGGVDPFRGPLGRPAYYQENVEMVERGRG